MVGEPRGDELAPPPGMGLAGALDAWDEHLAGTGAELLAGRLELTAALRPLLAGATPRCPACQRGRCSRNADISYRQRG